MLKQEDNQILTRVGPGTPMGNLFRKYWHPILYSYELPEADGPPVRVRLLCESLIAFRDSNGRIGLVEEHCPHRGASLFFGRNEDCGIRCIYHGWKFDVDGRCVDMPNEPPETSFQHKVELRAYPCQERGGIIWAYLGEGEPPGLPELEWVLAPDANRYMTKRYHECNWAQALEGDIDSSHVGFLHSFLDRSVPGFGAGQKGNTNYKAVGRNVQPRIETAETDFGLWVAARRPSLDGKSYWRGTALVLPYHTMIPPSADAPIHVNIWQPMDDEHTLVWSIQYHGARALSDEELVKLKSGLFEHYGPEDVLPPSAEPAGAWRARASVANDFQLDRNEQKSRSYSGLRGFWRQDRAMTESMGPIYDRSREHLGSSDRGIIQFRRLMIDLATGRKQNGVSLPGLHPDTHHVRATALVLGEGEPWQDAIKQLSVVRPGNWRVSP
jgi:phenylpropionate dioxygenase-like ring-hydroxylating dioxygenase large terminal subunit